MKLLDIAVKNFRSLKGDRVTLSLEGSDIIFLFGQNNAGKSSLLSAYEYLVTPKQKAILSDFFGFDINNKIEIEATFLKDEGDDDIFEKKGFDKWVSAENKIKFRKTWINLEDEGQKETFNPETDSYVVNGFGGIEQHFTKQAPTPIRIPALPTPKDLTAFVSDTVKKSVLKTLREEESEAYNEVVSKIEALQERILSKEAVAEKSLQANKNFQKVFPELTLDISPIEGSEFNLSVSLEKEFSVIIKDNRHPNTKQDFSNHGHGVIRQTLFNFLGVVKNELPNNEVADSNRKDYIILFEEPEVYLHPKAVKLLRKVLYELCFKSRFQIICASHSPMLIDISKLHTSLVRLVRDATGNTSLYQVGENLFQSNDVQKEMVQMLNRFDPNICESFFADEVILVEGDTEAIVARELLEKHFPTKDIFVVNTGSKNNIPFFQKIYNHFNIKQHIIHDSDTRFVYEIRVDENEKILYTQKKNKDGNPKNNSAWTINGKIWAEVENGNLHTANLSSRYVSIYNFEIANSYRQNPDKGKPLSAYDYVAKLSAEDNPLIFQYIKQIVGAEPKTTQFTQQELDNLVIEPV
jgi:predicted ATP-dependent endonuclease of OLD family